MSISVDTYDFGTKEVMLDNMNHEDVCFDSWYIKCSGNGIYVSFYIREEKIETEIDFNEEQDTYRINALDYR